MKYRDRVCWVSAVGEDPAQGGGVARAVNLIKQSGLIVANNGDLVSLRGHSKFQQAKFCIKMLFLGYRKFVIHSFFSPFSLFLLCIPLPLRVLILPHGELKSEALALNSKRKRFMLAIVRLFYFLNDRLKVVGVLATTDEELAVLHAILPVRFVRKSADFLSPDILLAQFPNVDQAKGINLVNVSRMVSNKGVAHLLKALVTDLASPYADWTRLINGVYLFYLEEDAEELAMVSQLSKQIRSFGISVYLHAGLPPNEIRQVLNSVPNRLGFLSSRFESFSYALIESLGFEYRPIVWFRNDLVDLLCAEKLCQRLDFGRLSSDEEVALIQTTVPDLVNAFINHISAQNCIAYQTVLSQTFGTPELLFVYDFKTK